jgi:hypothetical protein
VLVRREKLSLIPVDKPVESVDNKWIDPTFSLSPTSLSIKKAFSPPRYTRKEGLIHSYPHLFHIWG